MRHNCDKQEKPKTAFYNFSVKGLFWNISQNLPTPVPVSFFTGIFTVIFAKIFRNILFCRTPLRWVAASKVYKTENSKKPYEQTWANWHKYSVTGINLIYSIWLNTKINWGSNSHVEMLNFIFLNGELRQNNNFWLK